MLNAEISRDTQLDSYAVYENFASANKYTLLWLEDFCMRFNRSQKSLLVQRSKQLKNPDHQPLSEIVKLPIGVKMVTRLLTKL